MLEKKVNINNSIIRDVEKKMIELNTDSRENSKLYSSISTIKLVDRFVENFDKKINQILILNLYTGLGG